MMILLAVIATFLAFLQNLLMFGFGLKESAMVSSLLGFMSFVGVFAAECALIWSGAFLLPRFITKQRTSIFALGIVLVLAAGEFALPISWFSGIAKQMQRKNLLKDIQVVGQSVELLATDHPLGSRFALHYQLQFPQAGYYLTYPAYIGLEGSSRVFGTYFKKIHPEYHLESHVFEPGIPYEFIVIFDGGDHMPDLSTEPVHLQIYDGKDYGMAGRILKLQVGDLIKAALQTHPAPANREPAVPEDNVWDRAEKSLRLTDFTVTAAPKKAGDPLGFSFSLTNIGKHEILIPDQRLDALIQINYALKAIAPQTLASVPAGIGRLPQLKTSLAPGEKILVKDSIPFNGPVPSSGSGSYRLFAKLMNFYSTDQLPVQTLTADFSVTAPSPTPASR